MKLQNFAIFLFVSTLLVVYKGVEGRVLDLPREQEFELEKQLNFLNKPVVKTIHDDKGDIYDCVEFYKQAPFHSTPLLKNDSFPFQVPANSLHTKLRDQAVVETNVGLKNEVCPAGTVPIQRITKNDLLRRRSASKAWTLAYGSSHDYAVCRTIGGSNKFTGASAKVAVYNPNVLGQQFSASRLKLQNGRESIEAGWRVDPTLFGDHQTRLFVRTDAGDSHCFNTQCPGFVPTDRRIPLGIVFDQVSVRGGDIFLIAISIVHDTTSGKWLLIVGTQNVQVGYWPASIFSHSGHATTVEWGGEAFSPDKTTKPRMGAGEKLAENTAVDAFFSIVKVRDERGRVVDPKGTEKISTPGYYDVKDEGNVGVEYQRLIMYGGPGTRE